MPIKYPEGMVEWIRENYLQMDLEELTMKCNEKFNVNMSKVAMKSLKGRYGFSGGPRVKIFSNVFPESVCNFIFDNYIGTGPKEMTELIRKNLEMEYTVQQVKSFYHNHNLNSGITGRFEKGHISHNKGKKMSHEMYEKAKATMFKPGNRPHNAKEVGTIVLDGTGYYKIKVAEPNHWEYCHRREWEKNNGKIPEGMLVTFKDGNIENWNIENLMLITKEENAFINNMHLRSEQASYTEASVNVARLAIRVKERKRGV